MAVFSLTSPAFSEGEPVPEEYTCEGRNISPPLTVSDAPKEAKSLAVIVEDPDIPEAVQEKIGIEIFDHWVAYNIPPSTQEMDSGSTIGTQGMNSAESIGYTGPCPPAEHNPTKHRYVFSVYALDTTLDLPEGVGKDKLKQAMQGHVLETAQLTGWYEMQSDS